MDGGAWVDGFAYLFIHLLVNLFSYLHCKSILDLVG